MHIRGATERDWRATVRPVAEAETGLRLFHTELRKTPIKSMGLIADQGHSTDTWWRMHWLYLKEPVYPSTTQGFLLFCGFFFFSFLLLLRVVMV